MAWRVGNDTSTCSGCYLRVGARHGPYVEDIDDEGRQRAAYCPPCFRQAVGR